MGGEIRQPVRPGHLVELNLAGLDLEEVPEEVYACTHLRKLMAGRIIWEGDQMQRIGNRIQAISPTIVQLQALVELCIDNKCSKYVAGSHCRFAASARAEV